MMPPKSIQRRQVVQLGRGLLKLMPLLLVVGAVGAAVLWWPRAATTAQTQGAVWTCSMHPQVRLPAPGQCPICGMNLIPLADAKNQPSQPPGLEVEPIGRRALFKEIRTVGKLDYSEARIEDITARIAGRVDRLYADFTGVDVREGDHLVEIYSPELYSAQEELVRALEAYERSQREGGRLADDFARNTLAAARGKLQFLDITPEQIAQIERERKIQKYVTLYAPIGGTVIEKNVRLGQYVQEGDRLYRIAELDTLWLYLELFEYDIAWVQFGQHVEVVLEAFPGEIFHGTVTFIDPFLNEETRTIRVRVNMPNPQRRLKAGMYAMATIHIPLLADGGPAPTGLEGKYFCPMHPEVVQPDPGRCSLCGMELIQAPERSAFAGLHSGSSSEAAADRDTSDQLDLQPLAIRASAVLDTGRRQIAYRQNKEGHYELAELTLGSRASAKDDSGESTSFFPLLAGLQEGDRVVVRGGFLLDSQTQIEGKPSLLYPEGRSAASLHSGHAMPAPSPSDSGHQH